MAEPPAPEECDGAVGVRRVAPPRDGPFAAELAAAVEAFNRGDFRTVRAAAHGVLAGEHTPQERDFAGELLRRTGIDPVALIAGGIAAAACVWALIAAWMR